MKNIKGTCYLHGRTDYFLTKNATAWCVKCWNDNLKKALDSNDSYRLEGIKHVGDQTNIQYSMEAKVDKEKPGQ
jgi:hypothetical protein